MLLDWHSSFPTHWLGVRDAERMKEVLGLGPLQIWIYFILRYTSHAIKFIFSFLRSFKEMAIHSIILAWEISWTEEPGRLVFRVTRVKHDWVTKPPPIFCRVACVLSYILTFKRLSFRYIPKRPKNDRTTGTHDSSSCPDPPPIFPIEE